jgi:hypothetical protein
MRISILIAKTGLLIKKSGDTVGYFVFPRVVVTETCAPERRLAVPSTMTSSPSFNPERTC